MPWSRNRPPSSTRGYGQPHRDARKAALAAYRPGDPCCLCGHPMWPPTANLHLDHTATRDGYRGLAHGLKPCQTCGRRCNLADGARRARARQSASKLRW